VAVRASALASHERNPTPTRRALLAALFAALPARPRAQHSSDALRRRAEDQARQREDWWARQRQLLAEDSFRQESRHRRGDTSRQIERWEDQRQRRLWGRTAP